MGISAMGHDANGHASGATVGSWTMAKTGGIWRMHGHAGYLCCKPLLRVTLGALMPTGQVHSARLVVHTLPLLWRYGTPVDPPVYDLVINSSCFLFFNVAKQCYVRNGWEWVFFITGNLVTRSSPQEGHN